MKRKRILTAVFVLLAVAVIAGGVIALYVFYLGPRTLEGKRALQGPPSILVGSPHAGDTVLPDGSLPAQATVTGVNPIARVELWLDGEVVSTQYPESPNQTTYYAFFDLQVSLGTHMVFWRAVDTVGLVGQSLPVPIAGESPPEAGLIEIVTAEEGQSLEDIAESQGVDPELVADLNPDLGEEGLPAGTDVAIPSPAGQEATGREPPPANAPSPPPPNPPAGLPPLEVVHLPVIDLTSLLPMLLSSYPAAPSNLHIGREDCMIRLMWNDNASNESHFVVMMQALGGPALKIATLDRNAGIGPTWVEIPSPSLGIYSFWIEAVNGLGGLPSEIQWIAVNDASCGKDFPSKIDHLEIEALGMTGFMSGGWGKLYCYLSVEGAPEKRIPPNDDQFFEIDFTGSADIGNWAGGRRRVLSPVPADGELSLAGSCWGWIGNTGPFNMGDFQESIPEALWDNRTLQIRSREYVIDYRIRRVGSAQVQGAFAYVDYGIPAPHSLGIYEIEERWSDPRITAELERKPTLRWEWDGDLNNITGFNIYVNEDLALQVSDPEVHSGLLGRWFTKQLNLPSTCGGYYRIELTANSGAAQSSPSPEYTFEQPPCSQFAIVEFDYFLFSYIDDQEMAPCDTAEVNIWMYVNDQRRQLSDFEQDVHCNKGYRFSGFNLIKDYSIPTGDLNTFIVPIDLSNPYLLVVVEFDDGGGILDWDHLCISINEIPIAPMSEEEWNGFSSHQFEECTYRPGRDPDDYDGVAELRYEIHGFSGPPSVWVSE